ncbi:MAG: PorT family protein [Bacteroidota bacterium]|nr:PorT family protein [Bacteroidota bacterium]
MKIVTYFIIVFLLPLALPAQQFKAGLIGGVSATQISGDRLAGYHKAGIVAGGVVSVEISRKFDLAMEILYFQKGSRKNSDPENYDFTEYRLRLNYFEVPLLLQWNYTKRFTFEAGPTFGALLSELEEDELGEIPNRKPFEKFELGIAGGMKVHFAKSLSFTARIESSVLAVRDHISGETYRLNKGQYNAALLFGLQYTFKKNNE